MALEMWKSCLNAGAWTELVDMKLGCQQKQLVYMKLRCQQKQLVCKKLGWQQNQKVSTEQGMRNKVKYQEIRLPNSLGLPPLVTTLLSEKLKNYLR